MGSLLLLPGMLPMLFLGAPYHIRVGVPAGRFGPGSVGVPLLDRRGFPRGHPPCHVPRAVAASAMPPYRGVGALWVFSCPSWSPWVPGLWAGLVKAMVGTQTTWEGSSRPTRAPPHIVAPTCCCFTHFFFLALVACHVSTWPHGLHGWSPFLHDGFPSSGWAQVSAPCLARSSPTLL